MEQLTVTMPIQEYDRLKAIEEEMEKMPIIRIQGDTKVCNVANLDGEAARVRTFVDECISESFQVIKDIAKREAEQEYNQHVRNNLFNESKLREEKSALREDIQFIKITCDDLYRYNEKLSNQSIWSFIKSKFKK